MRFAVTSAFAIVAVAAIILHDIYLPPSLVNAVAAYVERHETAQQSPSPITPPVMISPPGAAKVEQISQGTRPGAVLAESFDGLGDGFAGPHGIGYSFGGTPNFAGQRFAGRLAKDLLGQLTLHETVLVEGEGAQTNTLRWEDYTQTAVDPSDDCTIWYVGDYFKKGAASYSSRIGAFRMPGCR